MFQGFGTCQFFFFFLKFSGHIQGIGMFTVN